MKVNWFIALAIFLTIAAPAAAITPTDFKYYKNFTIGRGANPADVIIWDPVINATLINGTGGDTDNIIHLNTDVQPGFTDIAFYDVDKSQWLNSWVDGENQTTTSVKVWFKIPRFDAATRNLAIFYVKADSFKNHNDPNNVFTIFDHFTETAFNITRWQVRGSYGTVVINPYSWIKAGSDGSHDYSPAVESNQTTYPAFNKWNSTLEFQGYQAGEVLAGLTSYTGTSAWHVDTDTALYWVNPVPSTLYTSIGGTYTATTPTDSTYTANQSVRWSLSINASAVVYKRGYTTLSTMRVNASPTTNIPWAYNLHIRFNPFYHYTYSAGAYDWIRYYNDTGELNLTFNKAGAEQSLPAPPTASYDIAADSTNLPGPVNLSDKSNCYLCTSRVWNVSKVGGGSTLINGLDLTKYFPSTGDYKINLTVTNASGTSYLNNATIKVFDSLPVAEFTANETTGARPLNVALSSAATLGNVTLWFYRMGDGTNTSALENPTMVYTVAGTYDLDLTVTNGDGNVSVKNRTAYITVTDPAPPTTTTPPTTATTTAAAGPAGPPDLPGGSADMTLENILEGNWVWVAILALFALIILTRR